MEENVCPECQIEGDFIYTQNGEDVYYCRECNSRYYFESESANS